MTGRYRDRSHIDDRDLAAGRGSSKWKYLVLGIAIMVLLAGIVAIVAVRSLADPLEIGSVAVRIEGRDAELTATYSLPAGIELEDYDLDLVSGNDSYPVEIGQGVARVEMGVTDVASILGEGEARISGDVRASMRFPPITMKREVDRSIDIASYLSLNRTMVVQNVTLGFPALNEISVDLDFSARLGSDVSLEARNTTATIRTALGAYQGGVDRLSLDRSGKGEASVRLPLRAVLALGWKDLVSVDLWGFEFSFRYPQREVIS